MCQLLVRLDRTTRTPNIRLLAVATGLGVLDFTVLSGKGAEALALAAQLTSLPSGRKRPCTRAKKESD